MQTNGNKIENLLIYGSILDLLDDMSNEEAGMLFKALNDFRRGKEVNFEDRYLQGLWKGILPNLNKLIDNYEKKAQKNRENGSKGGRPPKAEAENKPQAVTPEVIKPKSDLIDLTRITEDFIKDVDNNIINSNFDKVQNIIDLLNINNIRYTELTCNQYKTVIKQAVEKEIINQEDFEYLNELV